MNRSQLEHIIRAAGDIAGDDEIIILGSTAVLSQFPALPEQVIRFVDIITAYIPQKPWWVSPKKRGRKQ